jgi:hypothetical protein
MDTGMDITEDHLSMRPEVEGMDMAEERLSMQPEVEGMDMVEERLSTQPELEGMDMAGIHMVEVGMDTEEQRLPKEVKGMDMVGIHMMHTVLSVPYPFLVSCHMKEMKRVRKYHINILCIGIDCILI